VLVAVLLHIVGLILFSTFACVYETTLPIAGILHAIAAPIRGRDAVGVLAPASALIFSARGDLSFIVGVCNIRPPYCVVIF
jgi:hypothetical protein